MSDSIQPPKAAAMPRPGPALTVGNKAFYTYARCLQLAANWRARVSRSTAGRQPNSKEC
jgi:hypothetical protein